MYINISVQGLEDRVSVYGPGAEDRVSVYGPGAGG